MTSYVKSTRGDVPVPLVVSSITFGSEMGIVYAGGCVSGSSGMGCL